jgi:hypothetical protein
MPSESYCCTNNRLQRASMTAFGPRGFRIELRASSMPTPRAIGRAIVKAMGLDRSLPHRIDESKSGDNDR